MSDEYYLADLFAEHLTEPATVAAVREAVTLLETTDRPVTAASLTAILGDSVDDRTCENVVHALENTGIVATVDQPEGQTTTVDRDRLARVTYCAEVLAARERPPENELVATIPEDEETIKERHFGLLLLRLRELINDAERDVFLITPFFSETIADRLVNPLEAAASRGVNVTITTRYLTYGDVDYNREFLRELLSRDAIAAVPNCTSTCVTLTILAAPSTQKCLLLTKQPATWGRRI